MRHADLGTAEKRHAAVGTLRPGQTEARELLESIDLVHPLSTLPLGVGLDDLGFVRHGRSHHKETDRELRVAAPWPQRRCGHPPSPH
jgi:hypothetical protein